MSDGKSDAAADRNDLFFELRYAVRVLELQARYWRRLDVTVRFISFLATTAAFAAIVNSSAKLAVGFGVVLAVFQGIEYVLNPPSRALEAAQSSRLYQDVLASNVHHNDAGSLERAIHAARAKDGVSPFETLRVNAYNDVAQEMGCDRKYLIPQTGWHRFMASLT